MSDYFQVFKITLVIYLLDLLTQNIGLVHSLPLHLVHIVSNKKSMTGLQSNEVIKNIKWDMDIHMTDGNALLETLQFPAHSGEAIGPFDIIDTSIESEVEKSLVKREAPDDILNIENRKNESGARASSIPFLSKGESEGQGSSSGLPSVPGLPQIPGLPDSSTPTATAVIGGFSMLFMPMPGLSASNLGSALQAGQQLSQFIPPLPG